MQFKKKNSIFFLIEFNLLFFMISYYIYIYAKLYTFSMYFKFRYFISKFVVEEVLLKRQGRKMEDNLYENH